MRIGCSGALGRSGVCAALLVILHYEGQDNHLHFLINNVPLWLFHTNMICPQMSAINVSSLSSFKDVSVPVVPQSGDSYRVSPQHIDHLGLHT